MHASTGAVDIQHRLPWGLAVTAGIRDFAPPPLPHTRRGLLLQANFSFFETDDTRYKEITICEAGVCVGVIFLGLV